MQLTEVTATGVAYICLGGFVVAFSLISLLAREKLFVNEVVLGTLFGVLMGPYVANIFDPRDWGSHSNLITLEVMRIVLVTGLFAIGVELPKSYMAKHAKSLIAMVVPTMAIGWLIVAGLVYALIPKLSYVSCLAISACLTPTDPIICAAIVGGRFAKKHVPLKIRQILSAESAANDGLAYPFLSLAIYLTIDGTRGVAFTHWVLIGWLYQVFFGTIVGAVLGKLFSFLMKQSHNRGFIDRESFVAQYLALAILIAGIVSTLGSDDLLAAFAAGSAISWDGNFNTHIEGEIFASVVDLVFNCACFIYIGAWLPFNSFNIPELGVTPGKLVALAVGIMFLRRIPAVLMLYKLIPEISSWKEALFCGHFGPMGVGAVFVSALAVHRLEEPVDPPETQKDLLILALQPVVAFVVLSSIIIHGLSIPFFNIGRNVSHTVSLTATLTNPNRSYPEWLLGTSRNPTLPTQPAASSSDRKEPVEEEDIADMMPPAFSQDREASQGTPSSSKGEDASRTPPVLADPQDDPKNPTAVAIDMEVPVVEESSVEPTPPPSQTSSSRPSLSLRRPLAKAELNLDEAPISPNPSEAPKKVVRFPSDELAGV